MAKHAPFFFEGFRLLGMLAGLAGAAAGRAVAAEGAAKASPAAPSEEPSISAAKRDLDLIKSSRDAATRPSGTLPAMSVPELQPGLPDLSPRSGKKRDEDLGVQKSGNWLLEGVRRSERASAAAAKGDATGGRDGRAGQRESEADLVGAGLRDTPGTKSSTGPEEAGATTKDKEAPKDDARAIEQRAAAANPLTPFMQGWMTPQDYALLKPADSAVPGGVAGNSAKSGIGSDLGAAIGGDGLSALSSGAPRSSGGNGNGLAGWAGARENPFLDLLSTPAVVSTPGSMAGGAMASASPPSGGPISSIPATASVLPPAPAPQSPAPTPPGGIPDFAKPKVDDKYFKPLKRF